MNDLTWLARNVHEWPVGAAYIAKHENFDRWCSETHFGANYEQHDDRYGKRYNKAQWLAERERLQNKPSWEDAPEWAVALGQDADGEWNWLPHYDPTDLDDSEWMIENSSSTKTKLATKGEVLGDWRDTLENRPEQLNPAERESTLKHTNCRCVMTEVKKEWKQGDLPPVGEWCEIEWNENKWIECQIQAITEYSILIRKPTNEELLVNRGGRCAFRPLKTEEEKAVEDMERIYRSEPSNPSVQDGMRALYQAGYRKP